MTSLIQESLPVAGGGQILRLTLNRPEAMNSFSRELIVQLEEVMWKVRHDREIRAMIITGSGRAFCAGADLKERAAMTIPEVRTFLDRVGVLFSLIETSPFPVLAAINGYAFGGGLELALACDVRIASDDAQMGLTETSLGIIPGAGGTQRLTRLAGIATAKELILTARKILAKDAHEKGIVHEVVPGHNLLERAAVVALEIAANAPVAVAQAKFAIDRGFDADLNTGLAIERKAYEVTLPTSDRVEALAAFQEKRRPVFRGE